MQLDQTYVEHIQTPSKRKPNHLRQQSLYPKKKPVANKKKKSLFHTKVFSFSFPPLLHTVKQKCWQKKTLNVNDSPNCYYKKKKILEIQTIYMGYIKTLSQPVYHSLLR